MVDDSFSFVIGGDFNEILLNEEKLSGVEWDQREMNEFRVVLTDCGFYDCGVSGFWFIWERGNNMEIRVRECLDRFLINESGGKNFLLLG